MMSGKKYDNFREMGNKMQEKPVEPSQQNFTQLINWMAEVKTEVQKYTAIMNEYRLQQMRQAMEMKDFISKLSSEKLEIGNTMHMILQHLTQPGGTTSIDGAILPTPDAIAIKVIELMKRPMMIHKSWDYQVHQMPDGGQIPVTPMPPTSSFPASDDGEKEEVKPDQQQLYDAGKAILRKRITYAQRMDEMMLTIMQQQGGEWNTNKLIEALIAKYPHTTFKKPSVATAFNILMNAGTIFRVDRGMYQAKEVARG